MLSSKNIEDQELVGFLFESKKWAFEEIYKRYWKRLLGVAFHHIGVMEEAEGLVQEIFLSLWKRRADVVIKRLDLYLTLAIKNKVYDYIKSQISYRKYQEYLIFQELKVHSDTENIVNYLELTKAVEKVLDRLPEKSAEIFKRSRFEDQSVKQIAGDLNLSSKAVEYHITKSLKFLQENLKAYHYN
ncbi:sigma-70 family RNA polymerase sigma factor [Arcticibacterium luteifluviistationis]|uniref:RNA polymerase sigma-70 factor n=1 Tax=Arcticibacterium luteifluviistationis TaxID=1784714 RepID=A0A2Z4G8C2_9BACT|nr:sigma-70 family RNA polymerase sigma factor [Arcticibacterium luteifluviistationis]AWV97431.1 RNA polymerase sigma-70 factor [Arcticibacterium luteifluviistationis]